MRRTLILLVTLGALVLSAFPAAARDFNLPPGKWWENDHIVAHLELTADQRGLIKDLVYEHAARMIDLNAALEKSKLALENQVEQENFDPKAIRKFFADFQEARRLLESERFEMLLSVRQVVTHEQWEKMLSLRERLEQRRQHPDGPRPGPHPPRNGPRPPGGPGR
ncbi:MAG: periplasmic heavy metal sensor [Acidobacteriota bacterium]